MVTWVVTKGSGYQVVTTQVTTLGYHPRTVRNALISRRYSVRPEQWPAAGGNLGYHPDLGLSLCNSVVFFASRRW